MSDGYNSCTYGVDEESNLVLQGLLDPWDRGVPSQQQRDHSFFEGGAGFVYHWHQGSGPGVLRIPDLEYPINTAAPQG